MTCQQSTEECDVETPSHTAGPVHAGSGDRWVATLAHELRDPLNAVVLALHALRPACDDEPAARAAREMAEHGSRHMARIIDDVLELCRGGQGNLSPPRGAADLGRVVSAAVETVRPLLAAGGHRLVVSLPPAPASVEADPSRLEQILTNLLSNAARYTNPGGHISLSAQAAAGSLVIRVRDDGIGIPPELLPGIFDPRREGPAPRDRSRGGLGIGLALVKSLVQLHGGSVAAYSDGPGSGSEFVVRLPARGAP